MIYIKEWEALQAQPSSSSPIRLSLRSSLGIEEFVSRVQVFCSRVLTCHVAHGHPDQVMTQCAKYSPDVYVEC